MSTLHERLLAELDHARRARGRDEMVNALRVVVERHKPVPCGWLDCKTPDTHRVCSACGAVYNFPCPDITAIARELGIETGDTT